VIKNWFKLLVATFLVLPTFPAGVVSWDTAKEFGKRVIPELFDLVTQSADLETAEVSGLHKGRLVTMDTAS
jgi:hypothetical protein